MKRLRELENTRSLDEATMLIEKRAIELRIRPVCGAAHVVRNGRANGLQRDKCCGCGVSFNALTGTALAGPGRLDQWLGQAAAMVDGSSVRKTAARLRVHRSTAFRWRHRWLQIARETKTRQMTDVVEAEETYHLQSYKDQKARLAAAARKPRRRGGVAAKRGISAEHTPIGVLVNRHGDACD